MYEFQCRKCQKAYTVPLDPNSDDLQHQECPKGHEMQRVFSFQMGHIDWVNGDFHGEGINMGLGKHFKSARERDYYAESNGLVRQDKYTGDTGDGKYEKQKAAKERVEKRLKENA
jgi:hypothetical protein